MPSLSLLKINLILRYLERTGRIIIDNDGYIIWIKDKESHDLSFGEVANIKSNFADYLKKISEKDNL